jgi:L-amino acid N-acyltransferase YncA
MIRVITDDQERIGKWFCKVNGHEYSPLGMTFIGLESQGEIVAATAYDCANGASIHMHVAITGRFNREALWYAFHYPFIELGVKKIIAPVHSTNTKALRLDHHFGFITEAIIKDAAPNGDLHLLTMTKEQCRYLK